MKPQFRYFRDFQSWNQLWRLQLRSFEKSRKRTAKRATQCSRRSSQRLSWDVHALDLRNHSLSLAFDGDIFQSKMMIPIISQYSNHLVSRVIVKEYM